MKFMNSHAATSLAAALAMVGLAACGERHASNGPPRPLAASPSAMVIGTTPAEPTGDPPGTTPVSAASEVSKPVEQTAMPLPGQPNDHSNLAAKPSQKAGAESVLKNPAEAKKANAEPPAERT
jgi:predicted component of type VI protein secretion system